MMESKMLVVLVVVLPRPFYNVNMTGNVRMLWTLKSSQEKHRRPGIVPDAKCARKMRLEGALCEILKKSTSEAHKHAKFTKNGDFKSK